MDANPSSSQSITQDVSEISEDRQRLIYRGNVLLDDKPLSDYRIVDGNTIHLVARPENYLELREAANASSAASEDGAAGDSNAAGSIVDSILANMGAGGDGFPSVNGLRDDVDVGGGVGDRNAPSYSLEHIRQDILTMHTIMSTTESFRDDVGTSSRCPNNEVLSEVEEEDGDDSEDDSVDNENDVVPGGHSGSSSSSSSSGPQSVNAAPAAPTAPRTGQVTGDGEEVSQEPSPSSATKKFFVGQWLDVKDTVNQWLEATVLEMDGDAERFFIHYNGWPPRWDEWICWDSDRVAPFRTRTFHSTSMPHASPAPVSLAAHAPRTGHDDLRGLLPELMHMSACVLPFLQEVSDLASAHKNDEPDSLDHTEARHAGNQAHDVPWTTDGDMDAMCPMGTPTERNDERLRFLAGEVAPLIDRLGRAFTDLAPHLARFSAEELPAQAAAEAAAAVDAAAAAAADAMAASSSATPAAVSSGEDAEEDEEVAQLSTTSDVAPAAPAAAAAAVPAPAFSPYVSGQEQSGVSAARSQLEATLSSLMRPRPPSPPPQRAYRQPVSTSTRPPFTLPGIGGNGHLDIHIHAILTPLRNATTRGLALGRQRMSSAVQTTTQQTTQQTTTQPPLLQQAAQRAQQRLGLAAAATSTTTSAASTTSGGHVPVSPVYVAGRAPAPTSAYDFSERMSRMPVPESALLRTTEGGMALLRPPTSSMMEMLERQTRDEAAAAAASISRSLATTFVDPRAGPTAAVVRAGPPLPPDMERARGGHEQQRQPQHLVYGREVRGEGEDGTSALARDVTHDDSFDPLHSMRAPIRAVLVPPSAGRGAAIPQHQRQTRRSLSPYEYAPDDNERHNPSLADFVGSGFQQSLTVALDESSSEASASGTDSDDDEDQERQYQMSLEREYDREMMLQLEMCGEKHYEEDGEDGDDGFRTNSSDDDDDYDHDDHDDDNDEDDDEDDAHDKREEMAVHTDTAVGVELEADEDEEHQLKERAQNDGTSVGVGVDEQHFHDAGGRDDNDSFDNMYSTSPKPTSMAHQLGYPGLTPSRVSDLMDMDMDEELPRRALSKQSSSGSSGTTKAAKSEGVSAVPPPLGVGMDPDGFAEPRYKSPFTAFPGLAPPFVRDDNSAVAGAASLGLLGSGSDDTGARGGVGGVGGEWAVGRAPGRRRTVSSAPASTPMPEPESEPQAQEHASLLQRIRRTLSFRP